MAHARRIVLFLAFILAFGHGYAQLVPAPETQGNVVAPGAWTLLSDKDDLVFQAQRGTCRGHEQLWLTAENKSAQEIHVFVTILLDNGFRSPRQIVILKPNQIQEFSCASQQSLMIIPIQEGTNPVVTLEYQINKRL